VFPSDTLGELTNFLMFQFFVHLFIKIAISLCTGSQKKINIAALCIPVRTLKCLVY